MWVFPFCSLFSHFFRWFCFFWLVGFHHHQSFIWVLSMLFKAILKTWTPRHVWKLWKLNIIKWHIIMHVCMASYMMTGYGHDNHVF
jgi:hypothetical protein